MLTLVGTDRHLEHGERRVKCQSFQRVSRIKNRWVIFNIIQPLWLEPVAVLSDTFTDMLTDVKDHESWQGTTKLLRIFMPPDVTQLRMNPEQVQVSCSPTHPEESKQTAKAPTLDGLPRYLAGAERKRIESRVNVWVVLIPDRITGHRRKHRTSLVLQNSRHSDELSTCANYL